MCGSGFEEPMQLTTGGVEGALLIGGAVVNGGTSLHARLDLYRSRRLGCRPYLAGLPGLLDLQFRCGSQCSERHASDITLANVCALILN